MKDKDLEQYLAECEKRELELLVDRELSGIPGTEREALREKLMERASLQRLEHGELRVSVRIGDQWFPLDRAVQCLRASER